METFLGIDYPTWWFLVVGALFSGYAILDGFDLGAGSIHLFLPGEKNRQKALNAVGPVWDGNEVWLVIGGGALFAGFPVLYASIFSGMYIPVMLFLLFIILRAISIEFRGKEPMPWWRLLWDISYSVSSFMLSILLGVVLGSVLYGMPLNEQHEFEGSWLYFLNPFAISVGLLSSSLMMMHGCLYLAVKSAGELYKRVQKILIRSMIAFILIFISVSFYTLLYLPRLSDSFKETPALFVLPLLAVLSIANIPRLVTKAKYKSAFVFSSLTFSLLLILVAFEVYPVLLYSNGIPENNITIYNAASSTKALKIMLLFAAVGIPLVVSYTVIVYKAFWGKVKLDEHSY